MNGFFILSSYLSPLLRQKQRNHHVKHSYFAIRFFVSFLLLLPGSLLAQCTKTVTVDFTSINFKAGSDFNDSGGLDPVLEIFDSNGNLIFMSHFGDLSQVTMPVDDIPIDLNAVWNPCGANSSGFTLGTFPADQKSEAVSGEVYEKDSNFFNPECGGYNLVFDNNFTSGTYAFDLDQTTGTLDFGGVMTYNYVLKFEFEGAVDQPIVQTICANDSLSLFGELFYLGNNTANIFRSGNPNACDTNYLINVEFYNSPSVILEGNMILCPGQEGTLNATGNFESAIWNSGETSSSIEITEAGNYTVTVSSSEGCSSTATIDVEQSVLSKPEIQGEFFICENSATPLAIVANNNLIEWSTGDNNETILADAPGTYSVSLTDNLGCQTADTTMIVEFANPKPSITGPDIVCENSSIVLRAETGFVSYNWSTGNSDTDSLVVTEGGLYELLVTDGNGCIGMTSKMIDQVSIDTPIISGDIDLCAEATGVLEVQQSYEEYAWSTGETSQIIDISTGGLYELTVTNAEGCTATTVQEVNLQPVISPDISGALNICLGFPTELSVTEMFSAYLWNDGTSNQSLVVSETGIYMVTVTDQSGCTGLAEVEVTAISQTVTELDSLTCDPTEVGIIDLLVSSSQGCSDTLRYNITLDTDANCSVNFSQDILTESCDGAIDGAIILSDWEGTFPISVSLLSESMLLLGIVVIESDIDLAQFDNLSGANYLVRIVSGEGYVKDLPFVVPTYEPMVSAPIEIDQLEGTSTLLIAAVDTTRLTSFFWQLDDEPLCNNCLEIEVMPTKTTEYSFIVTRGDNCSQESSSTVNVVPDSDLYIPNVFDPGLPSTDNSFMIQGPGAALINEVTIWDRWGSLVFTSANATLVWDGNCQGQPCSSGVYVYKISLTDGEGPRTVTGTITLIR